MRIGIDATPLCGQMAGIGNYLFYLLAELISQRPSDQFYLYAIRHHPTLASFSTYSNVVISVNGLLGISEALWSQTTLSWMCYRDDIDLFWGVTQSIPLVTRKKQHNVITIHDFAYCLYPHTTSTIRTLYLKWLGKWLYKRAKTRLVISQGTAHRLEELYSLQAHGIVTPPLKVVVGADINRVLNHHHLTPKNYFLMVGTIEPRKNFLATLQAYCELIESTEISPLVLVGRPGWKHAHIQREITRLQRLYPDHVKRVGFLPDQELSALIQQAKAYIMPSLYEGYGMPIAEARSLGTPIICTAIEEMIEAAEGDGCFVSLDNFCYELQQALINPPSTLNKSCNYLSNNELAKKISSFF